MCIMDLMLFASFSQKREMYEHGCIWWQPRDARDSDQSWRLTGCTTFTDQHVVPVTVLIDTIVGCEVQLSEVIAAYENHFMHHDHVSDGIIGPDKLPARWQVVSDTQLQSPIPEAVSLGDALIVIKFLIFRAFFMPTMIIIER